MWRSINRELLTLPDDVAVFPTHGAGSFCSAAGGAQRWSTIGTERRGSMLGPTMASLAMMVLITLMFVGSASLLVAVIAVGAVAVLVVGVLITIIGALR